MINSLTGALTKQYVCKGCNRGANAAFGINVKRHPATACPFHHVHIQMFESRASLVIEILGAEKHKTNKVGFKSICEKKRNCAVCNKVTMSKKRHQCFKTYCALSSEQGDRSFLFYATVKERIASQ